MAYVTLEAYPTYEILDCYPYTIRNKKTKRCNKDIMHKEGYICVSLNGKKQLKHRVIAEQFIPNPQQYDFVDHINGIRTDYHLENLRWCDRTTNNNNVRSSRGVTLGLQRLLRLW